MAVAAERERWKERLRRALRGARDAELLAQKIRRALGDEALQQPPSPVKRTEKTGEFTTTVWEYLCQSCGDVCANRRTLCFPCEARLEALDPVESAPPGAVS